MESRSFSPPDTYWEAVAAGRRARAHPLRRISIGIGLLAMAVVVAGPFLMRRSDAALDGGSAHLVLSTQDDVGSPSGVPGLDSWLDGTVLTFGDPGFALEPSGTTGAMDIGANAEAFGPIDVSGVHLVEADTLVGSAPSISLQRGDLLFVVDDGATTLTSTNAVAITREDVVSFRPDIPGDYSAGTFTIVLDSPLGAELRGLSLVEVATDVGDVPVASGSFLLSRSGGAEDSNIYLYTATGTGEGSTAGSVSVLLSSSETGIDEQVYGVDLIEENQGGPLTRGSILVTLNATDAVGSGDVLTADEEDIFVLHVTGSGPATTTAEVVFRGSEVGLADSLDAIAYVTGNHPPAFDQDLGDRSDVEGAAVNVSAPATDPDGDTITYSATGLPPGTAIDTGTGSITGTIGVGALAGSPYAVEVRATDPGGLFDTDTFAWVIVDGELRFQHGVDGYFGIEDTDIWEHAPSSARGDQDSLTIDLEENGSPSESQGLIRFGGIVGTGAGQIPPGSTINSASLQVYVFEPSPHTITFHPMVSTWDEASTWNSLGNGIQRDGFEASGVTEVAFVATDTTGQRTISGFDGSVQAWVNGTLANNGWAIFSDGTDGWDFDSSEYATAVRRPRLLVDFTPNAPPSFDQDLGDRSDPEGAVISLSSAATDPEGHGITYSATGLPPGLSINPASGLISGTISLSAAAGSPYAVQIDAIDDYSAGATDTFNWTVTNTNQAPVVTNPGDRTNNENESPFFGVVGNDPDGDSLTWSAAGLPDGLSIDPGTGVISGTLTYSSAGVHPVTVRATDPGLLFDEVAFTWTVLNVNRGPTVVHPGHQTVAEGDVFSLFMSAVDPDGEPFTWSATGLPPGLSIDPITGEISGTVVFGAADSSPYASTVRATDNGVPSASGAALVNWTVTDTNRAPVVTNPGDQATDEGVLVNLPMAANDPDGDGLTWSASGLPTGLAINPGTGTISGVVDFAAAAGSPYSVVVTATDDGTPAMPGEASFTWTINDVNRPPSVTDPGDQTDAEDDVVSLAMSGSDPDSDTLTWSAAGLPLGLSINPSSGLISGTLTFSSAGTYPVSVRATDDGAGLLFDEVAFAWDVAETNRPPVVANPGDQSDAEGDVISLVVSGSDQDLDSMTWSAAGLPDGLSIHPTTGVIGGTIGFTAASGSPFAVTIRATDDGTPALFDEVALMWSVADVNRAPTVASPGDQNGAEGDSVGLPVAGMDPDGDAVIWSAIGLPPGVGIDTETGELIGAIAYSAADGSPFAVTVRATDQWGLFGEASFSWSVSDTPTVIDVTKTSDVIGRAQPGDTIVYTVVVNNPEATPATSVTLSDPVPAGTTFVPGSGSYSLVDAARDSFESGGYGGDDGTIPWSGPWVELDGAGMDAQIDGVVASPFCVGGSCLFVKPDFTSGTEGMERQVDLAGRASATLTYRVSRSSGGGAVAVRVRGNGLPWTTLATYDLTIDDTEPVAVSFDISAFAGFDTMVRLESITAGDGRLFVDDVAVITGVLTAPTGPPPDLVSGVTLAPGASVTTTFSVVVDDPPPASGIIANTATVATAEEPGGASDAVADSVNRYPVFLQDLGDRSDPEGTIVSLSASATDPDGDARTWSATGLPAGLSIDQSTGLISGAIGFDAFPGSPYAVLLTVEDVDGLQDLDSFLWTVSDTNRPPVLVDPGAQSSAEGDVVSLVIAGSDPDLDTITWSATGLPDGLAMNPVTGEIAGTITYDASTSSPYVVTIRATDDGLPNRFDEAVFMWTVADTNRPPVLVAPVDQTNDEGQAVSLPVAASDPDLDTLTWTASSLPPGLLMDSITGVISGTLTYEASSTYTVNVRVTDDRIPFLFDEVSFVWDVVDVNRRPIPVDPGDQGDAEGDVILLPVAGSDPDLDTLIWTATGLPDGLSIDPATGVVSGTISYDASPSSPFAVTVTATDDGTPILADSVAFSWTVADTNRPPLLVTPGDRANGETDVIALPIPASDPDLDTLTWMATGLPDGLSIDSATGEITGTVSFDAASGSPFAVTVTVEDDRVPTLTDEITFSWLVANTNRAPVVAGISDRSSDEGDSVLLPISGYDPDADGVIWSASGLPTGLSISPTTGIIFGEIGFTASTDSPHVVMVTAADDGTPSLWTTIVFTWTVADINRPPVIVDPGAQASAEGDTITFPMIGSDPDGDVLTWIALDLPDGLTIDAETGVIAGTIGFEAAGFFEATISVTDDRLPNLSDEITLTWTVAATNRAPIVTDPGDQIVGEGEFDSVAVAGLDPDGDDLFWTASGLPGGASINSSSGVVSGTLTEPGVFSVTVTATDDGVPSLAASVGFTWTVTAAQPVAPIIEPLDDRSDRVADGVTIVPVASSPDGETLVWSATGLPGGVAIDVVNGLISGILTSPGVFEVEVTVIDSRDLIATAGFVWTVGEGLAVDEPPRAEDDVFGIAETALEDGRVLLDVLGNDSDPEGTPLTITWLGTPEVGEASIVAGAAVSYRPPADWLGTTDFTYVVADAAGNTDTASIVVTIQPDLDERAAGASLQWVPPEESRPTSVVGTLSAPETTLVVGSIVQSLHVLRMPLTLLGGAVVWSLLLGGAFNLTLLLRGGVPFVSRKARLHLAVVLAGHGQKIPAHIDPGEGEVIHRFGATAKGLGGTGRIVSVDGVDWAQVETPEGRGWVEATHLTEHVDADTFAEDPAPAAILDEFVATLRSKGDLSSLVSQHGLWVSHHDDPIHYEPFEIAGLTKSSDAKVWKGRNPAFPDIRGSFQEVIAASLTKVWERPERMLGIDKPSVPSTIVPVEYTNFHAISIGAKVTGRDRLDQVAWMAHFAYEDGTPYLIALTREG